MDYIDAIHKFIDPIVTNKEAIVINELPNETEKDRTFQIVCDSEDTGRLIGKHGSVAEAIREVISIIGKTNGEKVHIKFTSNTNEKVNEETSENE